MSTGTAGLRAKIASAGDLRSVVRTMKALAASSVGQYENSVKSLGDYYQTVELGLGACFRDIEVSLAGERRSGAVGAIVFGSDQGLVGAFNDVIADFAIKSMAALPIKPKVWAVGERVRSQLTDAGFPPADLFSVPSSVEAITPLVDQIQVGWIAEVTSGDLYVFHNQPKASAQFEPVAQRLLPLDAQWMKDLAKVPWPTPRIPERLPNAAATLRALIQEYIFISLFKACADSLASENSSRLAAMERADQNIADLLESLNVTYHRLRQSSIDEELFDVIAGFEALGGAGQK